MPSRVKNTSTREFRQSRDILNNRPTINYIEPDQIVPDFSLEDEDEDTLDNARDDVDTLIEDYQLLAQDADALSKEIDAKAKDLVINLDPVQDSHIIDALERVVLDEDIQQALNAEAKLAIKKKQIPYALYKQCIKDTGEQSLKNFHPQDPNDVLRAEADPFRTNFGASGKLSGLKRPELDESNKIVEPVNLKDFKAAMIIELFSLLTGPINGLIIDKVKDLVF